MGRHQVRSQAPPRLEKLALVGGAKWMDGLIKLVTKLMSGETRSFSREQIQEAWDWLKA
ncbi:MAG: STAS/SEC14 domain-containing protein [Desulfobaccales bacterium]